MPEVSWQQPECPILAMHITVLSFCASDPGYQLLDPFIQLRKQDKCGLLFTLTL